MAAGVFVSYAESDRGFARALAQSLVRRGIAVADPSIDIKPGKGWPDAAMDMLIDSEAVVLVMSGKAANSAMVLQELGAATARHKRIVPVRIDHHSMPVLLRDKPVLQAGELSPDQIAATVGDRLSA